MLFKAIWDKFSDFRNDSRHNDNYVVGLLVLSQLRGLMTTIDVVTQMLASMIKSLTFQSVPKQYIWPR